MNNNNYYNLPELVRENCRNGLLTIQTSGQASGYAQANLVILPQKYAFDFLLFCQRNPKPCPLLEVLESGEYLTKITANNADIRTDLPKYKIFRNGEFIEEVTDITSIWEDDFVTFIIGCSFSFESAMLNSRIPVRHIEENKNVPMYNTSIPCQSAGVFSGNLVVSMRPLTSRDAIRAVELTSRFPRVHGSPIHIGDPAVIGIQNINQPDYGDAVTIHSDEIPVFWACGVTPQAIVMKSKPHFCITHAPGCMLVLDLKNDELSFS